MASLHQDFLKLCQNGADSVKFTDFMIRNCKRNSSFSLPEVLQELNKQESNQLWKGILGICNSVLGNFHFELAENEFFEQDLQDRMGAVDCLQEVTKVINAALQIKTDKDGIEPSLHEIASILHGILMSLPEAAITLQDSISRICELWWSKDFSAKEELIPHMVPYLLMRCLQPDAVLKDIKRLWQIRNCLLLLDYDDPSADSTKLLLLRCYMQPLFLKTDEGRRILTYTFGLHVPLIEDIHATIKNNIPSSSRSLQEYYGEVYFRAWRSSSGPYREKIENFCIQDLMHHAIHARISRPSIAAALKRILDQFHREKKQSGVDKMLLTLYQPIIWRSLKVANAIVRANAAALLFSAFPLHDPDGANEDIDILMQRQFDAFADLLQDPCPNVREVTVKGVCRAISIFWELIPIGVLNSLLNKLVNQLANDGSSTGVRCAVIKGLSFILDNHLSQPSLKALLPKLTNHIHDFSERVRLAFIDLLILVKGSLGIKFWEIVPSEHLLARLEMDTSEVAGKIVELLFNSFIPLTRGEDVQITRCVTLLRTNSNAARRFYQFAVRYMSVDATGKYIITLCRYVLSCLESDLRQQDDNMKENVRDHNVDNGMESEVNDEVNDEKIMQGLMETIAILWTQIYNELQKPVNENICNKLKMKFGKALPVLWTAFKTSPSAAATITIAGCLPATQVSELSQDCYDDLVSVSNDALLDNFNHYVSSLCMWGRCDVILEQIMRWLQFEISSKDKAVHEAPSKKKKRSRKTALHNAEKKPELALRILDFMMRDAKCRPWMLARHDRLRPVIERLKLSMDNIENVFKNSTSNNDGFRESSIFNLKFGFEIYHRLLIHLAFEERNNTSPALFLRDDVCDMLSWVKRVILPNVEAVNDKSEDDDTSNKKRSNSSKVTEVKTDLGIGILEVAMTIVHDALVFTPINVRLAGDVIQILKQTVTKVASNRQIFLQSVKIVCHLARHSLFSYIGNDSGYIDVCSNSTTLEIVKFILETWLTLSEDNSYKASTNVNGAISVLIWTLIRLQCVTDSPDVNYLKLVTELVICDTQRHLKKLWHADKLENFEANLIKPIASSILGVLFRNSAVERRCAEEIIQAVNSSRIDFWYCAAIVQILRQFKKDDRIIDAASRQCLEQIQNYFNSRELGDDQVNDSRLRLVLCLYFGFDMTKQELMDMVVANK
ncbi:uncharacterized protein TRIADDRAFT_63696 [Trichoplax adhaerens]|uniref:Condensin-2 complex subunit G2 n=1 Tax=Trichoplax adhaerens TaxID=10228 RepID=B3RMC3_TRIAD|nr:hypothetical protein TRIADDRAFT_63696 [Trichoplax adhaerens]EDV27825.1 hypothetical protein TRIADDRAFT_63696 [Trichoplax adhaerens]|eukprot:XP_002109659.1 hypothetical protein TRIADDRAFT_63696 [Trichoplax adhaerens]